MATSGSPCPKCHNGQLKVRTGKTSGEFHTRYLKCAKCGHADQQVVRCEMVLRRAGR